MKEKTTVFISGATGNMGWAGFKELYARKDRFNIRLLARPSKKNREKLAPYIGDPSVTVVWGDLCNYNDVLEAVTGSDYVLHVGGMVSPAADYYPEKTLKVNVLSAENVAKAVMAQPDHDKIKLVYIGSVAQLGDRRWPFHWGRSGDPVIPSAYDKYSVSKCLAEKAIVDCGVKHWVSLRQSGILYPGIISVVNPTAFHVPVAGVLEWCTIEDAGVLLANVCEPWVEDSFWNNFYNIGSGESFRMSNYEFESRVLSALGLGKPERVFEAKWFATRNFHGMWYADSDRLENYLHFRHNVPADEYFVSMKKRLPWFYSLAFLAPSIAIKLFMRRYAYEKDLGTQYWAAHDPEKLNAYYGSREKYEAIKTWNDVIPHPMEKNYAKAVEKGEVVKFNHGYDESKSIYDLTDEEISAAAAFRGGKFLGVADNACAAGNAVAVGNAGTADKVDDARQNCEGSRRIPCMQYLWECENGHRFTASLEYVLLGGGWCCECDVEWPEKVTTEKNVFYSQLIRDPRY